MHPADVADHVAGAVAELAMRLAADVQLRAGEPLLERDVHCYIPVTLTERAMIQAPVATSLLHPSGAGIQFVYQVPDLGAPRVDRDVLLYLDLTDFDADPPTAELLAPDRRPLPGEQWPKSLDGQGIVRDHAVYGRPFFCRRGVREYHEHPQHEDDPWDAHREGLPLHAIVTEILADLQTRLVGR